MNLHIRIWAPVSECECSVLPLIFKPLLAMAEGGGRPEEEGEREKERDGVMWRSKCRLWRDKDREWERAAKQTKPKRESIKKNNDQQPSSHRVRFLLFFFFNHSHPRAALDLLFCCYDGKRDDKKKKKKKKEREWSTHKNTPFIVQNRLRLQLLMTSGTCWMRARQQTRHSKPQFQQHDSTACVRVSV